MVTWFRYKDEINTNTAKGHFDLRLNKITDGASSRLLEKTHSNISIIKNEKQENFEEFQISPSEEKQNEKDLKKVLDFRSEFFKEFSNRSFKEIFDQIRRYYQSINYMFKSKVDYSKLKFLSEPQICTYIQSPVDSDKNLYENLDWHSKLKKLHLRIMDKQLLNRIFSILSNSGIVLQSLTLECTINKNLSSQAEFDINNLNVKNYFSKRVSDDLTDIHLVNFKIDNTVKVILDLLLYKIHSGRDLLNSQNKRELPFKNISFRKNPHSSPLACIIDLQALSGFFMKMASALGGIEKVASPFECLDLSGCDCVNLDGLKEIINEFKIIKEINLTNTK